jgi:hypothetical protein
MEAPPATLVLGAFYFFGRLNWGPRYLFRSPQVLASFDHQ